MTTLSFDEVDRYFKEYFDAGVTPGLVYGVARGDELLHSKALGDSEIGLRKTEFSDTYRVASITKSFVAAAILLLRDRELLGIDHKVIEYLPELSYIAHGANYFSLLTLRDLMTMSPGFPTDNPWADRMEEATDDELISLIQAGLLFNNPPNQVFEYSNLGFAILGIVIKRVTGISFIDFIEKEFFIPLALENSTFQYSQAKNLVTGYVRRDNWDVEPHTHAGAFSPIGGLITNIADLITWSAYLSEAFDEAVPEHGPLSRSSRREMQRIHLPATELTHAGDQNSPQSIGGYGFGLVAEEVHNIGRIVSHSGGYPGFGAHMRWHTASGLSIFAFANAKLSNPAKICAPALISLLRQSENRIEISARLKEIQGKVISLVMHWDGALADQLFAMNMDLDSPREYRKSVIERVLAQTGSIETTPRDEISKSPSHLKWTHRGQMGSLSLECEVTPTYPITIQSLYITYLSEPAPINN